MTVQESPASRWSFVKLTLLAWLAMIGIDFFFHGGIFAGIYEQDHPFFLSTEEAFRRIPLGYLAFLATTILLVWVIQNSSARGWRSGLILGLGLGALMSTSSFLGLYSIATLSLGVLAAWFVAQLVEIAVAGAVIGEGLSAQSLRKLTIAIVIGLVVLFVGAVVAQNLDLAILA